MELIIDFYVMTQAKIFCTICLRCKHVYLGVHDMSKCSSSYGEQNVITLNMSESMDGDDGISIRSLLKANFNGMTSLEIYAHHSAKIMEKTQAYGIV